MPAADFDSIKDMAFCDVGLSIKYILHVSFLYPLKMSEDLLV